MAREVNVEVRCDLCQRPAHRKGVEVTVKGLITKLGGREPVVRELDLCKVHDEEILQPLLHAMTTVGFIPQGHVPRSKKRGRTREDGPIGCQVDGCGAAPLKHVDSFTQHIRRLHAMERSDYVDRYGPIEPLTPEQLADWNAEAVCPECGEVYSTKKGHRYPQSALGAHRRGRHLITA